MAALERLIAGADGKSRCSWCGNAPDYVAYHDTEWGFPVTDDRRLFEKLCLEGFQAGLSWLTILRKREGFRRAFLGFDFNRVAQLTDADVERIVLDASIVRHRGKILSTINNARRAIEVVEGIRIAVRLSLELRGQGRQGARVCAEEAGLDLRRSNDGLRVHAGDGDGGRPCGRMPRPPGDAGRSQPSCKVAAEVSMRSWILALTCLTLPVFSQSPEMKWADSSRLGRPFAKDPSVIKFGGRYLMYFSLPGEPNSGAGWSVGIAESKDLKTWARIGEVAPAAGAEYEKNGLAAPQALVVDGKVHLFYQTYGNGPKDAICHAVSTDAIHFTRDATNPIWHPRGPGPQAAPSTPRSWNFRTSAVPLRSNARPGHEGPDAHRSVGAQSQGLYSRRLDPDRRWPATEAGTAVGTGLPRSAVRGSPWGRGRSCSTPAPTTTRRNRLASPRAGTVSSGRAPARSPSCDTARLARGTRANRATRGFSRPVTASRICSSRATTTRARLGISPMCESRGRTTRR